jgi:acetylornithine deacetylase/succinyl-diaminopimelate desuccinylase-like protein
MQKPYGLTLALTLLASPLVLVAAETPSQPYQRQALELFRHVIGLKTEIGAGQVPVMARYLADQFRAAGFASEDIHIVPLGETAALVVRYRGKPGSLKPILALAHMDVVTAKPSEWQRDPFALTDANGFFYGRGTLDIKSGVVSITSAFLRLKAEGFVPDRDLIAVFTGDEETSQSTALDLAHHHRDLINAEFALNSDAGGGTLDETDGHALVYELQTAEKTYASYTLTVHNPGGHSSEPRADNAIYDLADALKKLQAYRFPVMWTDETREYFRSVGRQTPGVLGRAMQRFAARPLDHDADETLNASPTYVGMIRTTCVPTLLAAGHADNALPQTATATVNCRIFPGTAPAAVQDTLQRLVGPQVEVRLPVAVIASGPSPLRPEILAAVTRTVHRFYPGVPIVPVQESGATDGAVFRGAGIPTYGVGENFIKNSDDFSHGLNERVPVASFYTGLDFWYFLLKDIAGPNPPAAPGHE